MTIFHSVCLGIIQGITEFLPISSSAHLLIFSKFLGLPNQRYSFDVFLNLGTLTAILVYFYPDIYKLFYGFIDLLGNKKSNNRTKFLLLFYSSLPTIIILGIMQHFLSIDLDSPIIMAIFMIIFSLILWFCDLSPNNKKEISIKDGIIIGVAQIAAIIPGVSRLGVCLSVSRYLHYSREESFKFSMLLSVPIFLGACTLKLAKVISGEVIIENWNMVFIGCVFSFLIGLLILYTVTSFLKKHTWLSIIIYRIIFAMFLILHYRTLL